MTIKPEIQSVTESVYASGFIKSKGQYNVFGTVNGVIKDILVKEGDLVKKGDPIMIIQNQTAFLNSENAMLNAQYNDYTRNEDKLVQIQKDIELAGRKLKSDSLLMVRQNTLWNQGIGTKTEQEQRELSFQNTKTSLENLKLKLNDAQKQLKFSSAQSRKNLQITQSLLSDYTVKSEVSGRVYAVMKEIGEMVTPVTQLGVIGNDKNFIIEMQLDEYDITKLKQGQEVIVRLESYGSEVFEATVSRIIPIMNEKSRTFTVEANFVKKPDILYPNLTIEASIIINKKDNVMTIPVLYIKGDKYVTLKNGTQKEIKTGLKDHQITEVTDGLNVSDEIILTQ